MNIQNTKNEQLSSFLDAELPEQDIEPFIDSLLEETPEAEKLVKDLKDHYLLSSVISNEKMDNDFIYEDRSSAISKQVELETTYSKPTMIQLEVKNIPKVFNWFKTMSIGSAIAASFGLIVANLFHTQSVPVPSVAETYDIKYNTLNKPLVDSPEIVHKPANKNQLNDKDINVIPVVNKLNLAKKIDLINEIDNSFDTSVDKSNQNLDTFLD